ncbi:MAG: helix-turn-helix transcriptional regulator [Alphaproteobacteria bacterium]|nr:helix-turn-helix transcriptional regulator [Alphaproteobacteria bacterium]
MPLTYSISPTQSKAARTYLDWTQQDLGAAAGIDRSTVRSFESGLSPRRDSVVKIRKALEKQGIEFTEDDGVKRRSRAIKIYQGADSRDAFYNDILQTVKEQGGDIHCVIPSQALFMSVFGVDDEDGLERLEILSKTANIKCLVTESSTLGFFLPTIQFRLTTNCIITPSFFFGYGNKYVNALKESRADFAFAAFHMDQVAQSYRIQFMSMWKDALPLRLPHDQPTRCARILATA